jgi:Zn-dependent peptidase ImmA (M78 family)
MNLERSSIEYTRAEQIEPTNMSVGDIEAYAARVREALEYKTGEYLTGIVDKLNGRIVYQELEEWKTISGSIYVHAPFDFDICLGHYTTRLRDQFTIAHELGHFYLHSDQGDKPIIAFRLGSSRIETEANYFAAAFLMPADEFRTVYKKNKSIYRTSVHFKVSTNAVEVRKNVLGL